MFTLYISWVCINTLYFNVLLHINVCQVVIQYTDVW
jgi:hypothetical protein